VYEEVICEHTTHLDATVNLNTIQLQWDNSADNIRGYHIFRNNVRITSKLSTEVTYLDENLPDGNYEYYVRTYYEEGCGSDSSNHVWKTIGAVECEAVNDLFSEKCNTDCVLLTWNKPESDLQIDGFHVFRNEQPIIEELLTVTTYSDENLTSGNYEYYVVTHYSNGCISDSSNHIRENIELGVKEDKKLEEVILYPNPTTGKLQVQSSKFMVQCVEIFDVYGRKILEQKAESRKQKAIDIFEFQAGIYFAKITTEKGIATKKIIKY
jgi:hypothetical protein